MLILDLGVTCLPYILDLVSALILYLFFTYTQYAGIARGCGWQKIGAFVNLGSYYIVGVPFGILLAFVFHIGGKVKTMIMMKTYHSSLDLIIQNTQQLGPLFTITVILLKIVLLHLTSSIYDLKATVGV